MLRHLFLPGLLLLICFHPPGLAWGQEDELELIEKVETLQKQLDAEAVAVRDKAETELIELGPEVLEYLNEVPDDATADLRDRMTKVRTTLEKVAVDQYSQPSKITLKGSMTVGDALKRIRKVTKNDVECSDALVMDSTIALELEDVEFWDAMNTILEKSSLRVDRYGSQKPGQLMLTPRQPNQPQPNNAAETNVPTDSAKIFQAQVLRVDSSANLLAPNQDYTTVNLLVRWEPRLRPISVDIPLEKMNITDEFGDSVMLNARKEVIYGMIQPEIPEVEFSVQLPRIDRQIEELKSMRLSLNAVLPGRSEVFRFNKVSKLKPGAKISKAGAHVEFGGTRKNEDVYSVKISLSFDEDNNALESHQGWVFQNEVYLEDAKGNREEALSLETLQQDNQRVSIQYYFLEEPADRTIVYKTPASIVKLPVTLELKKIPMP